MKNLSKIFLVGVSSLTILACATSYKIGDKMPDSRYRYDPENVVLTFNQKGKEARLIINRDKNDDVDELYSDINCNGKYHKAYYLSRDSNKVYLNYGGEDIDSIVTIDITNEELSKLVENFKCPNQ